MHVTLATEAGATGDLVAAQLGHSSPAITKAHYTRHEAIDTANMHRVLEALLGSREKADRALALATTGSIQDAIIPQELRNDLGPLRSAVDPEAKKPTRAEPSNRQKPADYEGLN